MKGREWFAAALLIAALPSAAFEICDKPGAYREHRRIVEREWEAFTSKRIDEVERFHSGLIAEYERGKLDDAMLARFLGAFEGSQAWAEPLLLEWVRAYPNSAAAYYALANHYAAAGFAARGTQYAEETSEAQFLAMGSAFRKSLAMLAMGDRYVKRHSLSDSMRIRLGSTIKAGKPGITEIYRSALADNPRSLQVRIRYIRASAPKWGGSEQQLRSILDDSAPLSAEDRRYIEYLVLEELGSAAELQEQPAKAIALYKQSVPLCPGLDQALGQLMELQRNTKDYEGLEASTTLYIERYPRNGWAYTTRGWTYQERGRYKDAFADFEKGTQLGYGHAFLNLAWYYESPKPQIVPVDYRKALDLYLIADTHGVAGARVRAEKLAQRTGLPLK